MLPVIEVEAEEYFKEKDYKSDQQHNAHAEDERKDLVFAEEQSNIASGDCHQIGYRDIHSKHVSRNQDSYHHSRHQTQICRSLSSESLLYSTQDKLDMDNDVSPPKKLTKRSRKKKLKFVTDGNDTRSLGSENVEQVDSQSENGFALNNICNNSNGAVNQISCWNEVRKSICPEEAKILPSAAFLEHDIITKQRKEMLALMSELSTRDQELNDLVRSHQSQVDGWETDRDKLKELHRRLRNYENELQQSDEHLKMTLNEMKKVTNQKEMDGMELKKTKGEMEKLSQKIQENSSYLREMEVQNKSLMDSVKKLVTAKEDLEHRGKNLSSRLKSKAGELSAQASEISRLTVENKTLETKLNVANENIRNLKAESDAWKNRYCSAKDETDRLMNDNKTKDVQVQNLTTQIHETLQQTVALQKALFTSCEREKCKEEILQSLRKQQKRTMQEMANLRKLYERQTKDLTRYHLSVQYDNNHAGQGEAKEGCDRGLEKQSGRGEGRALRKSLEQSPARESSRDKPAEQKHNPDGSNDKNMSYNTHKPNFLRYESKEEPSTFLVKKKIGTPDGQTSQESEFYDERKDFIYSFNSELEENEDNIQEVACDTTHTGGKADKESENVGENNKKDIKSADMATSRSRNSSRLNEQKEKIKRRSKSLGIDSKGLLKSSIDSRPQSCSRGDSRPQSCSRGNSRPQSYSRGNSRPQSCSRATSPLNIRDRATSPITNFYTGHENTASLSDEIDTLSEDRKKCKSVGGKNVEETKQGQEDDNDVLEVHRDFSRNTLFNARQTPHNETSGVCLSSSECSSSTVSSPERGRVFDELAPADSDGMCDVLQRKFIPGSHKSSRPFYNGFDMKSTSIHLRDSPAVIADSKINSSIKTTALSHRKNTDDSCIPKHIPFAGRSFRLVDEKMNEDNTIRKEKWSESLDVIDSTAGLYAGSDEISGAAGDYAVCRKDHRIDLSTAHSESHVVNRGGGETGTQEIFHSEHNNHITLRPDSNAYDAVKCPSDKCDLTVVEKKPPFLSINSNDCNSFCQQSRPSMLKFNTSDRAKEAHRVDTQTGNLDRRRPETIGRCVRVVSPHQDVSSRADALCSFWRKDTTNQQNTQSDSSSLDSDQSDMSLFSISSKSNFSSIKEKLNTILARSTDARSFNGSKSRPHTPETKGEADTKPVEGSRGVTKAGSSNRRQNYVYTKNLGSDSGNDCAMMEEITQEDKIGNNNAYIVPLSSSVCSRPFLSTKGPSLYKHLSTIHFSEKSRRYEWGPQMLGQDSERKDKYQENKASFITYPTSDSADQYQDAFMDNCSNNNNNNTDSLVEEAEVTEDTFEDSAPYIDGAVFHDMGPNTNMDKFHHHFNNIVRKLSFSNIAVDVDDNDLERSVDTRQNNCPSEHRAPENLKRVAKRSEFSNIRSDESIFSPSQICVKVADFEKDSAVGENIVRQLDFSNSTSVDQSNLDIGSPCTSHFTNIFGFNFEDKLKDSDYENMNIPFACGSRQVADVQDKDDKIKHLDTTVESNEDYQNISPQFVNKPSWNICDHNEQIKFEKDKVVSTMDEKFKTLDKLSTQETRPHDEQHVQARDFELVAASLPDYFPDISSVIGDEDSVNVDGRGEGEGSDLEEFVCEKAGVKAGVALDNNGFTTPEPTGRQLYGHTSTPTKVKKVSSVSEGHAINDLNSSHCKKDGQSIEEKTMVSKEFDLLGVKFSPANKKDIDYNSNGTISFENSYNGDGIKENTDDTSSLKEKTDEDIRIIDSNSIVLTMRETGDKNKIDSDSLHTDRGHHTLGKSRDELERDQQLENGTLCSLQDEMKRYKDCDANQTESTKPQGLSIKCDEDASGLMKADDSSYLEGPWDRFEDRLSNFLLDTPRHETCDDHTNPKTQMVPMSPASKLHHLLLESQEMIRSLEKRAPFLK